MRLASRSARNALLVLSFLVLGVAAILWFAWGAPARKQRLWIYTSIYKEVIAEMKPGLDRAFPEADIRWFQGGSENVAARINTELFAGRTQADLILTSDPFWYLELKKAGKLLAYDSPATREVPEELKDPDHAFTTVRVPVMVIGYNPGAIREEDAPRGWGDLASPRFKDRLSMGSPLESGTNFMAVAMLSKSFGWGLFDELRRQELVAAGGNSSVINRIETRERPVGVVLLENILKARRKGSPVTAVYPAEGVIAVPSPIAITADSRNPELARRVHDWFFTDEAQRAIVRGWMYSPIARIDAPPGALPWRQVSERMMKWSPEVLSELYELREEMKTRFAEKVWH